MLKSGEAKTPPVVQNDSLKEGSGFVVRGNLRISVSEYNSVISSMNGNMELVNLGVAKYNEDWESRRHTLNTGSVKGDLLRCIRFSMQNVLSSSTKEQQDRMLAEDKTKREEKALEQQQKDKDAADKAKEQALQKQKEEILNHIPESENLSPEARYAITSIIKNGNDTKCNLYSFEEIYKYTTKKLSTDEKEAVDKLTAYQSLKTRKQEENHGPKPIHA